jgi:ribosome-associated protein
VNIEIAKLAQSAAESKNASDIVILDVSGKSDVCDFQLVCSGESTRQTVAIADAIAFALSEKMKINPVGIEGRSAGHWIALDYGFTICHVFQKELRSYYAIEDIWPQMKIGPDEPVAITAPAPVSADSVGKETAAAQKKK